MKDRGADPRAVDLSAFCRQQASVAGRWPLSALTRLAASFSAASDAEVAWSANGSLVPVTGSAPQLWLHIVADTVVPLQCQRCLQPLAEPLAVDRRLRFVRTEEEAARLDEESDDEVLVQPTRLDLRELVEDELILVLPLVPRHAECPEPLTHAADKTEADSDAPHPFAALAALRRGPAGNGGQGGQGR